MKTIPLRELLRKPRTVKKLTAAGQPVRVTDGGRPLWVIHPEGEGVGADQSGKQWIEAMFDEVLLEKRVTTISAGEIVIESRL